jgi:hypothetical protein
LEKTLYPSLQELALLVDFRLLRWYNLKIEKEAYMRQQTVEDRDMGFPFQIQVLLNDRHIQPQEEGYLGEISPGVHFTTLVFIPEDYPNPVFAYCRVGNRENGYHGYSRLADKLDYFQRLGNQFEEKLVIYQKKCTSKLTNDQPSVPVIPYPKNLMVLIEKLPGGQFRYWEVAITSQRGEFFLKSYLKFTGRCYRDMIGRVIYPSPIESINADESHLGDVLESIFDGDELPLLLATQRVTFDGSTLPPNMAHVIYYDPGRQQGAINTHNGPALVIGYNEQPRYGSRKVSFVTGETVYYDKLIPGDPQKTFPFVAQGVVPLSHNA